MTAERPPWPALVRTAAAMLREGAATRAAGRMVDLSLADRSQSFTREIVEAAARQVDGSRKA